MKRILRHPFRFFGRFSRLAGFFLRLTVSYYRSKGNENRSFRHEWQRLNAGKLCKILNLDIRVQGTIPAEGVLASNHVSYLDIIVYMAAAPGIFVSKSEVRRWPIIGPLAGWIRTVFLDRNDRSALIEVNRQLKSLLAANERVVLFPEGTSTDGSRVLEFHSSLFSPVTGEFSVIPCYLQYREPGGDTAQTVCWWGKMLLLPHLLNLLTLDRIDAFLRVGEPLPGSSNRKELTRRAYSQVKKLSALNSSSIPNHRS